jgi:hypothetical protein
MMHDVVEKHLSIGEKARTLEDRLALKRQLPRFVPRFVCHAHEGTANLGRPLVEYPDELSGGLECQWRVSALSEIQAGGRQNTQPEPAQLRHVRCQSTEWHGLRVRHEVGFVRHPFQRSAGFLRLFIEFRYEQVADPHDLLRGKVTCQFANTHSQASATANSASVCVRGPASCRPHGRPPAVRPQGSEIAG